MSRALERDSFLMEGRIRMSEFERIDPVFSTEKYVPPLIKSKRWLYPTGEYEAFMLGKMQRDVKYLKLKVGYPGFFRPPSATAWFRHKDPNVKYETNGFSVITKESDGIEIRITVPDTAIEAPSLASDAQDWLASSDGVSFSKAVVGPQPSGEELPRVELPLIPVNGYNGLYDVGREVLAELIFESDDTPPSFTVGESKYETLNVTEETQEQTFETEKDEKGIWKTPLPLAFRYILLKDNTPLPKVKAVYTPLIYRHTYDFADNELNRIWKASAYTLRLCIMTFQIDGVKRDRLPWGGDLALSLLANVYSFYEPEPIKRTLTVLLRDGVKYSQVNGILDYSLWCVISHGVFFKHFHDIDFLKENWSAILNVLDWYEARSQADGGFIKPVLFKKKHGVTVQADWCFIDWVEVDKTTALHMLYHWALTTASKLAEIVGDGQSKERFTAAARKLKAQINDAAFDANKGLYRGDISNQASPAERHPNFLAILSGVAEKSMEESIAKGLLGTEMKESGTPYMISMELIALHKLGHDKEALAKLRKVWGGMLKLGATTFLEGYSETFDEKSACVFYERPFAMSFCHAWSAAPCALLPILTGKATY